MEECNNGDNDQGDETSDSTTKSKKFRVDKSQIKSISTSERIGDLSHLENVDVFNQQDFEQGVLEQVNIALAASEQERLLNALTKQLTSFNDEIKQIEEYIGDLERAKERLGPEEKMNREAKQRMMSITTQEQNKMQRLTALYVKRDNVQKKMDNSKTIPEAERPSTSSGADVFGFVVGEEETEKRVRLGEITPFEAMKASVPSATKRNKVTKVAMTGNTVKVEGAKKKRNLIADPDGDWVPRNEDDDDNDVDYGSDESWETDNELGVSIKGKKRSSSRKKEGKTKRRKICKTEELIEDDWCEDVYRDRIRNLEATERNEEEEEEEDVGLEGGFKIPAKIWNRLFPYQRTGIRWLWELHLQEAGGILGDEMGLGKTIQVISLLAGLQRSGLVDKSMLPKYVGLGPVLIMCPATVLHQWLKEFRTWWAPFRVVVVHSNGGGSNSKPSRLLASLPLNNNKRGNNSATIVLSSYNTVHRYADDFLRYAWHYVVLDEGHKIRNPDAQITLVCKKFRTCHRIIMSGSPIQNNLKELWSLFDFIFPGKLGTLPDFMTHFNVPIVQGGYATSSDIQVETAYRCALTLRDTISPYLLRRMKSDVQSSISLPAKNEQVLFCRLSNHQREIYKEYLESKDCQMIIYGKSMAFPGLITLRKICNHPDMCTGGPKNFGAKVEDGEAAYGYWKRSGKLVVVNALLSLWKKQNHKVLLFTQSRQMLNIIEKYVQSRDYSYFRMDGSTNISSRQPLVSEFNNNPSVFLFLLTTRVGGLGINLTGATRVIIFDPDWNPSTDVQARERAWRIGQTKDVTIYRLLTTGTIEEKIYHRQIFKQFLTNRVLKDPRQRRFFKSNDLSELFRLGGDEEDCSTETSAIFSGTGSDVKIISSRHHKKKNKSKSKRRDEDGKERVNRFDILKDKMKSSNKNGLGDRDDNDEDEDDDGYSLGNENGRPGKTHLGKSRGDVPTTAKISAATKHEDLSPELCINPCGAQESSESGHHPRGAQESSESGHHSSTDPNFQNSGVDNIIASERRENSSSPLLAAGHEESSNEIFSDQPHHDNSAVSSTVDATLRDVDRTWAGVDVAGERASCGLDDRGDDGGELVVDEVVRRRRELARKLSLRIVAMNSSSGGVQKNVVQKHHHRSSSEKRERIKEKAKKKKKKDNVSIEGAEIKNLDMVRQHGVADNPDDGDGGHGNDPKKKRKKERSGDEDDYVLRKLFKKSGIHSAMHHDQIMTGDRPDYLIVEMEAKKVAAEAEKALKSSRERCRVSASICEPTWTGRNGSAGAPARPRFGQKKKLNIAAAASKQDEMTPDKSTLKRSSQFSLPLKTPVVSSSSSPTESKPSTSSRGSPSPPTHVPRSTLNPFLFDGVALTGVDHPDRDEDGAVRIRHHYHHQQETKERAISSKDLVKMLKAKELLKRNGDVSRDSAESPECVDSFETELMEDIRSFVAIGGRDAAGKVTTNELVGYFRPRVPPEKSALFKEMTKRLCNFYRIDGEGVFSLKEEFTS